MGSYPIKIANSSGFPLQIAVSSIVNKSRNWRAILEEHPWRLNETGTDGFIDIVAFNRNKNTVMVIECKRYKDTEWVFLIPDTSPKMRPPISSWRSKYKDMKFERYGWEQCHAKPNSYLSYYCAINGQDKGRNILIERVLTDLVDSIEAFANENRPILLQTERYPFSRFYIPVMVTTAKLFVAYFDPMSISLHDGSLPEETPYEEVPYVRFRKSLTTRVEYSASSVEDIHSMSERTIFIVNAEKLSEFLEICEVNVI